MDSPQRIQGEVEIISITAAEFGKQPLQNRVHKEMFAPVRNNFKMRLRGEKNAVVFLLTSAKKPYYSPHVR